jgi:ornithine cyclodeaminase/alanine dehydrogenase
MTDRRILYLSRADVERVGLDLPTIIALLERAFVEKGHGRVELPPKPGIHPRPDAFIHAMPAYVPAMAAAGMKWVGGYPDNPAQGLPYISGLVVMNDAGTGLPCAVMDCTWITAYRTGAATALAAKYLARPDSRTAGILACGVQGRTNLLALAALFPIDRVYAYDIAVEARDHYAAQMSARLGIEVVPVSTPREAVAASDIVVTSGPIRRQPEPTIDAGWLRPGAFASAVDFDSYWSPAALREMDRLVTDDLPQFRYYRSIGYFQTAPEPDSSLEEIVTGLKPGRRREDERTMAMNLGLAMEDVVVAQEIDRRARALGIGTWLDP